MVTFETEGVCISRFAAEEMFPARSRYHAYRTLLPEVWFRAKVVFSEKKLVSLVDVDELIVVETDDALLNLPKDSDQQIKEVYDKLDDAYK